MNDLSPSEVLELAEFLSAYSSTEEGTPMPLDTALRIVEDTDTYNLQLTPSNYLIYLKVLSVCASGDTLLPVSKLPVAFSNLLQQMEDNGFVVVDRRNLKRRSWRIGAIWFFIGSALTSVLSALIFR